MPANLRDPLGLTERVPELAQLAARAPALRRAIEKGLPHDAYRALYWGHKRRRFGDLGGVAAELLAHRRLFLKPVDGVPALFTLNGVGARLHGTSDFDPNDGTYITTLFVVVVFVPIFPIASYLVRDSAQNRGRSWHFIAKVPVATLAYLWQRVVALAILGLLAFGALGAVEGYGHQTVHVANALGAPVTVTLSGSAAVEIPSGTERGIRTSVGPHTISAVMDGRPIENASLDVPRGSGKVVVWNVLGAAPILARDIHYGDDHAWTPQDVERPDVFCGQRLITREGIDYAFETPPQSISLPQGSHETTKKGLFLDASDWKGCVSYLESADHREEAARLVMATVRARELPAEAFDDDVQQVVVLFAPAAEAQAFARELLERDSSVRAHRFYQTVLKQAGEGARLVAEYDARRAANPDDPDALYLALRLHPYDQERSEIDAAVARFPKHPFLLRASVYAHYNMREFESVVAAAQALRSVNEALWHDGIERHVEALVALGRGDEALALADGVARGNAKGSKERAQATVLALRVAHRTGKAYQALDDSDGENERYALALFRKALFGDPFPDEAIAALKSEVLREAMRIARDARTKPDAALARVSSTSFDALHQMPPSVAILLVGEAARREAGDALAKLAHARGLDRDTVDAMSAFVRRGVISEVIADLPLELRAALDVARSRQDGLSAKERAEIVARVKEADVFAGPVTVALQGWTP